MAIRPCRSLAAALALCAGCDLYEFPSTERVFSYRIEGCKEEAPRTVAALPANAVPGGSSKPVGGAAAGAPAAMAGSSAASAATVPGAPDVLPAEVARADRNLAAVLAERQITMADLPADAARARSEAARLEAAGRHAEARALLEEAGRSARRVGIVGPFVERRRERIVRRIQAAAASRNVDDVRALLKMAEEAYLNAQWKEANRHLHEIDQRLDGSP